jgi:hypothetical protein
MTDEAENFLNPIRHAVGRRHGDYDQTLSATRKAKKQVLNGLNRSPVP